MESAIGLQISATLIAQLTKDRARRLHREYGCVELSIAILLRIDLSHDYCRISRQSHDQHIGGINLVASNIRKSDIGILISAYMNTPVLIRHSCKCDSG